LLVGCYYGILIVDMTNTPKISIIIPTLNEERSITPLLQSIKQQTTADYEVIIADAGSTDQTTEIVRQFGATVVEGGMPAVGRNRGAQAAQGEYLLFLDADVLLTKSFLAEMISEFEEKELDIASCSVVPLSDKTIDIILHGVANAYISLTQYFYPHAPGFCILIKKSVHDQIGGFDESLKLAEDHDYVNRAQKVGTFRILKNAKIFVSVRRLESDGRFSVSAKYALSEVYRLMKGEIRTDVFKYKFGHHQDKK